MSKKFDENAKAGNKMESFKKTKEYLYQYHQNH